MFLCLETHRGHLERISLLACARGALISMSTIDIEPLSCVAHSTRCSDLKVGSRRCGARPRLRRGELCSGDCRVVLLFPHAFFLSCSWSCCCRAIGVGECSAAVSPGGPRAGRLPTPPAVGRLVWSRYWGLGRLWLGDVKGHIVGYLGRTRTPVAWTWMRRLTKWATKLSI